MSRLNGNSKIYGIIGDPVGHSVSPSMFNAAFEHLDLNCVYVPFLVKQPNLFQALDGIRALNISGINITIPHKVEAVSGMDILDSRAGEIGAVNTVVNRNGKLAGYNTDGDGFLKILKDKGIALENKKVVLLGAGGVSRAISHVLVKGGANLTILDRTVSKALEFVKKNIEAGSGTTKALELTESNIASEINKADMLINATSVGMNKDESIVNSSVLKSSLVVIDIVYTPRKTRLLQDAEAIGAVAIEGVELLIGQAVLSFELWTGIKAPVEVMKYAASKALGG
jgi:shikimate dehydrogenase